MDAYKEVLGRTVRAYSLIMRQIVLSRLIQRELSLLQQLNCHG